MNEREQNSTELGTLTSSGHPFLEKLHSIKEQVFHAVSKVFTKENAVTAGFFVIPAVLAITSGVYLIDSISNGIKEQQALFSGFLLCSTILAGGLAYSLRLDYLNRH